MKTFATVREMFFRWIDGVAIVVAGLLDQWAKPRIIKIVEQGPGEFSIQMSEETFSTNSFKAIQGRPDPFAWASLKATLEGNRVELFLRPDRFLFRRLELPPRAADFLDGIVRAQIDRLTPWTATEAAFGCSKPGEAGADPLVVTVAATSMAFIEPIVQSMADRGARSIAFLTSPPDVESCQEPIKVWEKQPNDFVGLDRTRKILITALASSALAAGITTTLSVILGTNLDVYRSEVEHRIASARVVVGGATDVGAIANLNGIERRKQTTLTAVMVLEILSDILPDQTYVTELRLEGSKLRLIGLSNDAPSLIGLIERSGRFTRATFFAPTTRAPADTRERFHIEAIIHSHEASRS